MKKYCYFTGILISFSALFLLYAFEENFTIGTVDNWQDLHTLDNTVLLSGQEGYLDIFLRDGEYELRQNTDLIIHFNDLDLGIRDFSYEIVTNNISFISENGVLGANKGAALFNLEQEGIMLRPRGSSFLSPGMDFRDFSIEFWLYPASLSNGERVLYWWGGRHETGQIVNQDIECTVIDRRLQWNFNNFFMPPDHGTTSFSVTGRTPLIPKEWRHHLLRYDSSMGKLEYLVDGVPEDIVFTTPTSSEHSTVYYPFSGQAQDSILILGNPLSGYLDEFRISSQYVTDPFLTSYPSESGSATTRVFDLENTDSRLISISVEQRLPGDSTIEYYYRFSNYLFLATDYQMPWVPFFPETPFPNNVVGRYLQLKMILYPNGTGSRTPQLSSLRISYEKKLPPLPPESLIGAPGNGQVVLTWFASTSSEIGGYEVFYGERPGTYFGQDIAQGTSPIDVGNTTSVTLTGLQNGRLYYFAVRAYSPEENRLYSDFSTELSVRPSVIYQVGQTE